MKTLKVKTISPRDLIKRITFAEGVKKKLPIKHNIKDRTFFERKKPTWMN